MDSTMGQPKTLMPFPTLLGGRGIKYRLREMLGLKITPHFLYVMLPVVKTGPFLTAMQYVMYFRFCG